MEKTWRTLLICLFMLTIQYATWAQDIVGTWKTIDDRTNLPTSHVRIYQENGVYYGEVVAMLRDDPTSLCDQCTGDKKNQPIMNMVILRDMVSDGEYWSGGRILDPESGKEYKCNIHLESDNNIVLRGYIGAPLFGRSQDWIRVE
jgi:uncharacterized protein (DUF2147 family)